MKTLETYLQEFERRSDPDNGAKDTLLYCEDDDTLLTWPESKYEWDGSKLRDFLATMYREVREETIKETAEECKKDIAKLPYFKNNL